MSDCMHFPDTIEEFMEQYKMTDTKQVYSNGTEYVPIFRMEQWFEHEKAQLSQEDATSDTIDRQAVIKVLDKDIRALSATHVATDTNVGDKISKFINGLEETFAYIREREGGDSVCGLCEYDGAYIGESGDWCNECPGFDRDDCFKLSNETRKKWTDEIINALPTIQPEERTEKRTETHAVRLDAISRQAAIDAIANCTNCGDEKTLREYVAKHSLDNGWTGGVLEAIDAIKDLPAAQPVLDPETIIRTIEMGIAATNSNDAYSLGMRNGMRWCKSLIDGAEPKFEDYVMSVDDGKELPSVQPETAKRIVGKSRDGMTLWYQCDMCDEPVDEQDNYCRGCGRRLIDG